MSNHTGRGVGLRAHNNDVQYTLKVYTLIFARVRVEFFFFFKRIRGRETNQTY